MVRDRSAGVRLIDIAALSTEPLRNDRLVLALQPQPQQHHRSGNEKQFLHGLVACLALPEETLPLQILLDGLRSGLLRPSIPAENSLNLRHLFTVRVTIAPIYRRLRPLPAHDARSPSLPRVALCRGRETTVGTS